MLNLEEKGKELIFTPDIYSYDCTSQIILRIKLKGYHEKLN